VDIRTGAEVTGLAVEKGAIKGVHLGEDETVDADTVVSSCDPKRTFLDWIPVQHVSHSFERRVRNYRMRGTTAKVHLALSGHLEWKGDRGKNAHYARTGNDLDFVERAFDAVKYRQCSERPVLDIHIPSREEPDLAPSGHEVVSIMVHYAPYQLEGGWNKATRDALGETVVGELERYSPGVRNLIVAKEVLTPADIESRYGVTGGHIHHGEHGLDQLITRPTPETAQYATPVQGLFVCGGSTHPGGGVSGAPGALAARAVLKS
jgi:phytoene dehydrogenase-like protein